MLKKISEAKRLIALKNSLLSYLLSRFAILKTDELTKTAATNGNVIYVNPDFINSLKINETVFILLHELLHITLNHMPRREKRHHEIFNVAADIVVNDILVNAGFSYGNLKPIIGANYEINGVRFSVEEVYEHLFKKGFVIKVPNHNLWSNEFQGRIKEITKEAIKKNQTHFDNYFIEQYFVDFSPKRSWKEILTDILKINEKDYTFSRVHELASNILMPSFFEVDPQLENVWVLVDVSGSMSRKEISFAFNEINNIINSFDFVSIKVSFFSTFVTRPIKAQNQLDLSNALKKIKSSGGTDFDIIFEYLKTLNERPIAIIIISDGYCRFPSKDVSLGIPVFWAINNKDRKPPFGHLVII